MLELICVIIINALIKVIFEDNWKPFESVKYFV